MTIIPFTLTKGIPLTCDNESGQWHLALLWLLLWTGDNYLFIVDTNTRHSMDRQQEEWTLTAAWTAGNDTEGCQWHCAFYVLLSKDLYRKRTLTLSCLYIGDNFISKGQWHSIVHGQLTKAAETATKHWMDWWQWSLWSENWQWVLAKNTTYISILRIQYI